MNPSAPSLFNEAPSRATDPQSSRNAAARARVGSQRAAILAALRETEQLEMNVVWVDADDVARFCRPQQHRSIWSTRLASMTRAGLLLRDAARSIR